MTDREADETKRGRDARAPGGGGAAKQGVTIPGYQPVELLGAAPSYGAWVRAVQVRMDRHVLLKVLKPDLPVAHEFFAREIQAVVRLDGDGVLRAIDEGTVRGFRYLVVDEAEGIPLSDSVLGGEEGWAEFARTSLDLWRRILERECVLLPTGIESWRRLPAGDFAAADLGWLVPIGEEAPDHPRLPESLRGRPLRPQDAVSTFIAAGEGFAAELGLPLPGPWRRAMQALAEVPEDAQFEDVLRALAEAKGEIAPPRTRRVAGAVAASLALVGALVWGTIELTREPEAGTELATVPVGGGEIGPTPALEVPPETPETEEQRNAREARERELSAAVTLEGLEDSLLLDEDDLLPFGPLPPDKVSGLRALQAEFPGTRAASDASLLLEWHELGRDEELRGRLHRTVEQVDLELSLGRVGPAEVAVQELAEEVGAPGVEGASPFEVALRSLEDWVLAAGLSQRSTLAARIEAAIEERSFRPMAKEMGRAVPSLASGDRAWGEEVRRELLAAAERYERIAAAVAGGIRESGNLAAAASFPAAVAAVGAVEGESEFEELERRRRAWARVVEEGLAVAQAVAESLRAPDRAERAFNYLLRDGSSVRGRVVGTDGVTFTIKLDGRRSEVPLRWLDFAPQQWSELAGGALTEERVLLVEALLGREESLERATRLAPPPDWTIELQLRSKRAANVGLGRLLETGREAHARGDHAAARGAAREIVVSIPVDLWGADRAEMEEWCRLHWESVGPVDAFDGARMRWSEGGSITLEYDFDDDRVPRGWIAERPGGGTLRIGRGGLVVQGSVWLAPGGESELFERSMVVRAEVTAAVAAAPNVNFVLFARSSGVHGAGDLFALGYKPPPPLAQRIDGEIPVFLPANVIGPVAAAERGRGGQLAHARDTPKVPAGKSLFLEVSSVDAGLTLDWKGTLLHEAPYPRTKELRRGTIQLRTYGSPLRIESLAIEAQLARSWWSRWLDERVGLDLEP
jgi:hypothetical protein